MWSCKETRVDENPMAAFRAVVFDLDGTLIDSNWLHLRSWRIAAERLGLHIPPDEIISRLGLKTVDIARDVVSGHDEGTIVELVELKTALFEESWSREVKAREGAREALGMIRVGGLRSAVASSNASERITRSLRHFGMDNLLDVVVGLDEVREGKPDPALLTVAIKRLGVPAKDTLCVGDSRYDIEAGMAAGARTALVVQSIAAQSNLKFQPDYRLRSLLELKRIIWPNETAQG